MAFCAGQDLNETKTFDAAPGEKWIREWERLYDLIRSSRKPLVAALNGVAAGSAFQVALLCDFRVGHPGVTMGQPKINSGIASTLGPWLMSEMLGIARTVDLTLSGRMMDAQECFAIGIINRIVPREKVMPASLELARELAAKPPVAMRLNKRRFQEMTEAGFRDSIASGGARPGGCLRFRRTRSHDATVSCETSQQARLETRSSAARAPVRTGSGYSLLPVSLRVRERRGVEAVAAVGGSGIE